MTSFRRKTLLGLCDDDLDDDASLWEDFPRCFSWDPSDPSDPYDPFDATEPLRFISAEEDEDEDENEALDTVSDLSSSRQMIHHRSCAQETRYRICKGTLARTCQLHKIAVRKPTASSSYTVVPLDTPVLLDALDPGGMSVPLGALGPFGRADFNDAHEMKRDIQAYRFLGRELPEGIAREALVAAVTMGKLRCVVALMEAGIRLDDDAFLISIAVANRSMVMLEALLLLGVEPSSRNLRAACRIAFSAGVERILRTGVKPGRQDMEAVVLGSRHRDGGDVVETAVSLMRRGVEPTRASVANGDNGRLFLLFLADGAFLEACRKCDEKAARDILGHRRIVVGARHMQAVCESGCSEENIAAMKKLLSPGD